MSQFHRSVDLAAPAVQSRIPSAPSVQLPFERNSAEVTVSEADAADHDRGPNIDFADDLGAVEIHRRMHDASVHTAVMNPDVLRGTALH